MKFVRMTISFNRFSLILVFWLLTRARFLWSCLNWIFPISCPCLWYPGNIRPEYWAECYFWNPCGISQLQPGFTLCIYYCIQRCHIFGQNKNALLWVKKSKTALNFFVSLITCCICWLCIPKTLITYTHY